MTPGAKVPKISVCIDSFNYGRFLTEAIESVLGQTYQDFELIICDDQSTDDSYEIAGRYAEKDDRIDLVRNPKNLGMVKNRNLCLSRARGEYVKWLHADDFLCSPEALARMATILDENGAVCLVASARRMVNERSQPIDTWSCFEEERPIAGTTVIKRCLFEQRNLIGGPSAVMFRRAPAARGFSEDFFVMADMEMWFHLLEQGCFRFIREPLCAFRSHGEQQTIRDRSTIAPAVENRELLRRYLHKNYVQFRRWIWKYLEYDAVRRIVRRARKLGMDQDIADQAVREWWSWDRYRRDALKYRYRETLLKVRRIYERQLRRPLSHNLTKHPLGINLSGFSQSIYGIGESSRAMWRAVQACGVPSALITVKSNVHSNADLTFTASTRSNPYRLNLMTFSFDYSRRFYRDMGRRFFVNRFNIGLWYWEQEHFPARWHSSFDYYDEIWVPSEFTRSAISAVSPIPVRKITYPFYAEDKKAAPARHRFGFAEQTYLFLFTFDFFSTIHRKNPAAVIDAFRRAFDPKEPVALILKSINAGQHPQDRERLGRQVGDANVIFIDGHVSADEINALYATADCYVSLHRSEGLGLGMAQAMALGKPVIATNYSGNLEFMNPRNSLLVDYKMTELEEDSGPYEKGTHWAEADVEEAAGLMRFVYQNRDAAEALGRQAAVDISEALNPQRTSDEIATRVRELR